MTQSSATTDVVAALRSGRYKECPELPDRVLRSIASKATNTRLAIRAKYKVWNRWCTGQRPSLRPYPATAAAVARFLQANAPASRVTRGGDFEVMKTGITPNGDQAKSGVKLSRDLGTLSALHIYGGHRDPTKDPDVLAVWRVLRRGLEW